MLSAQQIMIISGPTATGKTAVSLRLAQAWQDRGGQAVIVNFDSLLFYRELNIGTAKPTPAEQKICPHYGIDLASVTQPLSAGDYRRFARPLLEQLWALNPRPQIFLVGGSGFYLRALVKGMGEAKFAQEISKEVEELYQRSSITAIRAELAKVDPASLEQLHPHDHYRLQRALIYYRATGEKMSQAKAAWNAARPYDFHTHDLPGPLVHLYLDLPKPDHAKIIAQRSQKMWEDGLAQEAQDLIAQGLAAARPTRAIGHQQALKYCRGAYPDVAACLADINLATAHLAKAQRTFFKRITPKTCADPRDPTLIATWIQKLQAAPTAE
jgi:tRNA dimethylallyltransferase